MGIAGSPKRLSGTLGPSAHHVGIHELHAIPSWPTVNEQVMSR
jgi:hypothetical protein